MPCYDPCDHASQATVDELCERLDAMTDRACRFAKLLDTSGIGVPRQDEMWWGAHKAMDAFIQRAPSP